MEFAELERQALALSERDRASLAVSLLETLPAPGMDVSDEEIERRRRGDGFRHGRSDFP